MRRSLPALFAAGVLGIGCAAPVRAPIVPPGGILFSDYRAPLMSDFAGTQAGSKRGEASTIYVQDPILTGMSLSWGDASIGDFRIVYCSADELELQDSLSGAGILVIENDVQITNGLDWDGLIITLGQTQVNSSPGSRNRITGGYIATGQAQFNNITLSYSTEALGAVSELIPPQGDYYLAGWRELDE